MIHRHSSWSDSREAAWRKSSYSGAQGDCLEAAELDGLTVVRDSKNENGPVLGFTRAAWAAFVADVKRCAVPGA
ncbi:DUF397 domain-containing protein [Streptomyces varsoviensis]|uniref:DUF397 domain-containing protein n=1 Tax=Streptomyces varsoviensis TaxID=67373 RepID=UPI00340648C2